jgi:hypothetical protein
LGKKVLYSFSFLRYNEKIYQIYCIKKLVFSCNNNEIICHFIFVKKRHFLGQEILAAGMRHSQLLSKWGGINQFPPNFSQFIGTFFKATI